MSDFGDALIDLRTDLGPAASEFFPYVCSVLRGGALAGVITNTEIHSSVPCKVKATGKGGNLDSLRGKQAYQVEMPMDLSGEFNETKITDKIVVDELGVEPARTFQVHSVENATWTIKVICSKEG